MISSNKLIVQDIVSACKAYGIKNVIICPGSRNAPFSIAFDNHSDIETLVIHDERSAAFFALGVIDQIQEPVAIVCTSGSAIQNFAPAVSEAYYRQLPLIVISADRPKAWIDQGDGQTIRQMNVLSEHIRHFVDFSDENVSEENQWYVRRELNQAFIKATGNWKGPVHINVGLHEPLYDTCKLTPEVFQKLELVATKSILSNDTLSRISFSLDSKVLLLCGQMTKNERLNNLISEFASNTNIAVLVENTSNLTNPNFVHCIDRALNMITDEDLEKYQPDILISIGDAVVSKKIKSFLRKNKPKQHWRVGNTFPFMDTYQSLTNSFELSALDFFEQISNLYYSKNTINYGSLWRQKDVLAKDKSYEYLDEVEFSDLQVYDYIFQYIPEKSMLTYGK